MKSGDLTAASRDRFRFIRTARISEADFWLWEYTEADGALEYVFLRQDRGGSNLHGLSSPNGLSHEQYLLAEYYDEVYWS